MTSERRRMVDGEFDRPLPKRNDTITDADRKKMQLMTEKYERMKRERENR